MDAAADRRSRKKESMKRRVVPSVALVAGLVFAGGGIAWAGMGSHSVKVPLSSAVVVGAKTLPAGDYTFSWNGNGPQVDVTIEQHGKTIEQTTAKIIDTGMRSDNESVLTRRDKVGAPVLEEVQMRGQSTALQFKAA
jgi:hypothetical protein